MPITMSTSVLDPRVAEYSRTIRKRYAVMAQLPLSWRTNWSSARTKALSALPGKGSGIIFTYFSGSDWCAPCKQLHAEVFESETFLSWFHGTRLVPMLVDFPRFTPQSPTIWEQNRILQEQYKVTGFPTVLAIKALDNSKIGAQSGYAEGWGPDNWIKAFSAAAKIT